MSDFNEMKNIWDQAKSEQVGQAMDTDLLIQKAKSAKNESKNDHIMTILILSATVAVLSFFFLKIAPVKESLSLIAATLMIGSLLVRIIVEAVSLSKAMKLAFTENVQQLIHNMNAYYKLRVRIHGNLTYIIIALYMIGFYMLMPEFNLYLSEGMMWYINTSFPIIAVVLFFVIRKGVRKELKTLQQFSSMDKELKFDN